ncbi:carbon-nitrogen hydrolase family protein [Thalassomonas actiniarum]|uniref:Carbon-nitrogen hydrolase family protein n=1 Tax=Thalassomonas actiniarum TaxID=485447 RepID=A0AAE9YRC5_9GAMM|nr:carbon-nitrogen hydrolase family protein [Thalassomonas actiniarum]WDD98171.1 carbon-nitrogen hydrolase family protein [Thalassomonas actiniarum]
MVKLSAVQLCSVPDVNANLDAIEQQLQSLEIAKQHLVVVPECCLFFGARDVDQLTLAKETVANGSLRLGLAKLAQKYRVHLVGGTIPTLTEQGDKFTNSSCVFSPEGEQLGRYDKIHLFDVHVQDNEKHYFESKYTQAGKSVEVVKTPFANVGLSVCYDLRFPELYRQLRSRGADIITVPSAFTRVTGKAHWQTLLRARAIENQVFIVAANQEGIHKNGRETWGHSMIISPWGEVLSSLETGTGVATAEYSSEELVKVRESIPVSEHNQFKTELMSYE